MVESIRQFGLQVRPVVSTGGKGDRLVPDRYKWLAGSYDVLTGPLTSYRDVVVARLALRPGDSVVDVGCGTGLCFEALHERVGNGGTIIGVDSSEAMLALAAERVDRNNWHNVTLTESTAEALQLPEPVDAAVMCAVHDILRSREAIENVVGQLRPGARVAAAGGKWIEPAIHPLNVVTASAHAAFVDSFEGFGEPWSHLGELLDDFEVSVVAYGAGFIASGFVRDMALPSPQMLGERIRAARCRTGRSVQEVADAVGVSQRTVSRWEHGDNIPQSDHRGPLAAALGVDARELFSDLRHT